MGVSSDSTSRELIPKKRGKKIKRRERRRKGDMGEEKQEADLPTRTPTYRPLASPKLYLGS